VWRSQDNGTTWKGLDVGHPPTTTDKDKDLDPYLWVDPATSRIFSVPNRFYCSSLRWSIDDGDHWGPNALPVAPPPPVPIVPKPVAAGCGVPGQDHQSLAGGPPRSKAHAQNGYPSTLYYVDSSRASGANVSPPAGAWVTRSFDGGASWEAMSQHIFAADCQLGYTGAPAVAPDGTVYIAKPGCGQLLIQVSHDGGDTWLKEPVALGKDGPGMGGGTELKGGVKGVTHSTNPGVAVDSANMAYAVWAGSDGLLYLSHSGDSGKTWSKPQLATPPDVTVTAFSAIAAGGPGRIVLAYLATTADAAGFKDATGKNFREAHFAPAGTAWHLYETWSLNAAAENPVFTTLRLTREGDPVHRGQIWEAGDAGDGTPNRQLRDFLSVVQWHGRPYVAYADSCDSCTTPAKEANLWVATLEGTPSLDPGNATAHAALAAAPGSGANLPAPPFEAVAAATGRRAR
jgi:hypothetical protein